MWEEFLQRLISADTEFTYDDVRSWGREPLKALTSLGLLHEVNLATDVVCDACPEAHWEKVLWSANGTRAFIPCPTEGAVNIDRQRLRRWQIAPAQLAVLLARELGLSGRVKALPADRVWFIGQRPIAGRNRYFFFAAIEPAELPSIVKQIRLEHGRVTGGLLLPFPAPDVIENKMRAIHVANVATLKGRRIAVDADYIEEHFTVGPRAKREKPEAEGSTRKLALHRRRILVSYMRKKGLDGLKFLAVHLEVDPSALYGMIRQDRSRYSEEKLSLVLTKIGCSREQWNRPTPQVTPK